MTIRTSTLGGGGALVRLAPDLTAPSLNSGSETTYSSDTVTMVAGVEKEILGLTGKYAIGLLLLDGLINESMTIRMLNDGVEIWNTSRAINSVSWALWNSITSGEAATKPPFKVESSLSLLLTTTSDTSINIRYTAAKIL